MFKILNPNKGQAFSRIDEKQKAEKAAKEAAMLEGAQQNEDKDYQEGEDDDDIPCVPMDELAELMGGLTVECGGQKEEKGVGQTIVEEEEEVSDDDAEFDQLVAGAKPIDDGSDDDL